MSTIRKVLEGLRSDFLWSPERTAETDAALVEWDAVVEAAAVLRRLGVGDFIYKGRETRDHKRDGDEESGWNHPDVVAWGNAADLLRIIAAQRNGGTTGATDAGASGAQE